MADLFVSYLLRPVIKLSCVRTPAGVFLARCGFCGVYVLWAGGWMSTRYIAENSREIGRFASSEIFGICLIFSVVILIIEVFRVWCT